MKKRTKKILGTSAIAAAVATNGSTGLMQEIASTLGVLMEGTANAATTVTNTAVAPNNVQASGEGWQKAGLGWARTSGITGFTQTANQLAAAGDGWQKAGLGWGRAGGSVVNSQVKPGVAVKTPAEFSVQSLNKKPIQIKVEGVDAQITKVSALRDFLKNR